MTVALVLATILDVALGVLLIAVSGFVLEGVNNTGPTMPDAALFVAMIAFSFAAPLTAWLVRRRLSPSVTLVIALAPLIVGAIALIIEPAFV
jgi:hypothetical protein